MEQYPDAVIGWGFFDLAHDNPEQIDILVRQGFRGVKFIRPHINYSDRSLYPVYERVEKYELPALFHTEGIIAHYDDRLQDVASERMKPMMLDTIA